MKQRNWISRHNIPQASLQISTSTRAKISSQYKAYDKWLPHIHLNVVQDTSHKMQHVCARLALNRLLKFESDPVPAFSFWDKNKARTKDMQREENCRHVMASHIQAGLTYCSYYCDYTKYGSLDLCECEGNNI